MKALSLGLIGASLLLPAAAAAQSVGTSGTASAPAPQGGATAQGEIRIGTPEVAPAAPATPPAQGTYAGSGSATPAPVVPRDGERAPSGPGYVAGPDYEALYVPGRPIPYRGGVVPAGAHLESRPNNALIGTGLGVFGGFYVISALAGIVASSAGPTAYWMLVPVVGPFGLLATGPGTSSLDAGSIAIIVADGILQAAGVGMFVLGLTLRHQVVVFDRYVARTPRDRSARWAFVPSAPGAPAGASLTLTTF